MGINYSNTYDLAIQDSWEKIIDSIKIKINLLMNRKLNLYQKAIIVNCMILSKVWYTCHTYPLSIEQAKSMEKLIFPHIWNSKSNPVKRHVVYNKKEAGGLNILNVYSKAASIFTKSFLRSFTSSKENDSLVKYYCAIRLNPWFKIRELPVNVSFVSTPYYSLVIDIVRNCKNVNNFPTITSQNIYECIKKIETPLVEEKYSLFNWDKIWKNIASKFINSDDRNILFKYLHEILPNNLRLYNIKKKTSPNCDTCNLEESNLHVLFL